MRTSIKLWLTVLAAVLLTALAAATAIARSWSFSNRNIRATWSSLEFTLRGVATIRCPVTLEGNFHSEGFGKTPRNLIGRITTAIVNQALCVNGIAASFNGIETYNGARTTNTLPWHITYDSFTGTLPNITTIRLMISRFRWGLRDARNVCTAQYGIAEDEVQMALTREGGGNITAIAPVAGRNIMNVFRMDGGLACPQAELTGTGALTLLGNTTRIRVTLI